MHKFTFNRSIKVLVWFFSYLFSVQVMSQGTIADPLTQVQIAISQRDWANAETLLKKFTQEPSQNPFILYDWAQIYENTNRPAEARQIYQRLASMPELDQSRYTVVVRSADLLTKMPHLPAADNYMTNLAAISQAKLNAMPSAPVSAPLVAKVDPDIAPPALPVVNPSPDKLPNTAIMAAFMSWAVAWESQDLPNYYGSYVSNFQGSKIKNKNNWQKQRDHLVKNKKTISLSFSTVNVTILKPDEALLNFTQTYKSDIYSDVVNKTLGMTKTDGRWLINQEIAEPVKVIK